MAFGLLANGLGSAEEARHVALEARHQENFCEALGSLILGLPAPPPEEEKAFERSTRWAHISHQTVQV